MEELIKILGAIVLVFLTFAAIAVVIAFPVMLLWNWLMPVIFGLPKIGLIQALGLNLLSGLLIKSIPKIRRE